MMVTINPVMDVATNERRSRDGTELVERVEILLRQICSCA